MKIHFIVKQCLIIMLCSQISFCSNHKNPQIFSSKITISEKKKQNHEEKILLAAIKQEKFRFNQSLNNIINKKYRIYQEETTREIACKTAQKEQEKWSSHLVELEQKNAQEVIDAKLIQQKYRQAIAAREKKQSVLYETEEKKRQNRLKKEESKEEARQATEIKRQQEAQKIADQSSCIIS